MRVPNNRRNDLDGWNGKWFPNKPGQKDNNLVHVPLPLRRQDSGRIPMGEIDPDCDDAKVNLTVDFDPFNVTHEEYYICMDEREFYVPNYDIGALTTVYQIPEGYEADHYCMFDPIVYAEAIPAL